MTTTHAAALPLGFVLHEYRIERLLGHGGFGITYLATDTLLRKSVAIKEYLPADYALRGEALAVVPRSEKDRDDFHWGLERFLDEARTLARFRHPNLVPVMRFFEANGTGYMVMEFEDGQHAGDWFRRLGRRLREDEARALLLPLLDGLQTVHQAGYLHRDIKPGNIVIKHDGTPVLIDFGAARQALTGRSRTVTAIVTPRFAPLEQYSSEGTQGPWSDIYALGAVLYTGLAGEPPPEATARVPKDRFKPLAELLPESQDSGLLAAIDWALNVFANDRPQSVDQWRQSLTQGTPSQRLIDAPTVLARDAETSLAGAVNRGDRPVPSSLEPARRRRWRLVAGLALIAVLAAGAWLLYPVSLENVFVASPGPGPTAAPPVAVDPPPGDVRPPANRPGPGPRPGPGVTPNPAPSTGPASPVAPPIDALAAQATAKAVQEAGARAEAAGEEVKRAEQMAQLARVAAEKARDRAGEASSIVQNGVGLLELTDGGRYAGEVQNGRRHGFGITTYPSGDRLEGEWRDGRAHGAGIFVWSDGRGYFGEWRNGAQQGHGILQSPDGARYAGQWSGDQPSGLGMRSGADGTQMAGEWRGGKLHGHAVERGADGRRFEGQFAEGRYSGRGVLIGADGKRQAGVWIDGALTRPD